MSALDSLLAEPWRHDFFAVLRRVERSLEASHPSRPRIGDSATLADERLSMRGTEVGYRLGQNPFLTFPDSNVTDATLTPDRQLRVLSHFLGYFGPQGVLPLATTEEAFHFLLLRDDAFARFLDLFTNRFQQLFFRAWADARPAAQHDRPAQDRFATYVGAAVGLGSPPFRERDSVPDLAKLGYAGLLAPQAKSAARLRRAIIGLFGVMADIRQFEGSWLPIEPSDRTRLGAANSRLGTETLVGSSVFSVQDKITVVITVADLPQLTLFLPDAGRGSREAGRACSQLVDLLFFYVGEALDWDVELAIPAAKAQPVTLGRAGLLGWTSWIGDPGAGGRTVRRDTRFKPAERARARRARAAAAPVPPSSSPISSAGSRHG